MKIKTSTVLSMLTLVSACGGSNHGPDQPQLLSAVGITGVGAGTNFGFDIGTVVGNRYYVTDRNNAAVDVFDTGTNALLAQIKGTGANAFAGVGLTGGKVDNAIPAQMASTGLAICCMSATSIP